MGIDDYMVKPINFEELLLHIGALLRRAGIVNKKMLTIGSFVMNAEELTVTMDGQNIPVTVREFNILFKLLSYPQKAVSRAQLMEEFWDMDSDATLRAVDMYIAKIREKFSACPDFKIMANSEHYHFNIIGSLLCRLNMPFQKLRSCPHCGQK